MARVEVVPYDEEWPRIFERIRARVWPAVQHAALRMEHVGSTSVPGLHAKPVVDICIVVASRRDVPFVIKGLATVGYTHRGELGVPEREAFARPEPHPRHHLYVSHREALSLRNQLGVRDYLRSHPEAAKEYGALKVSLARKFPEDIDSYIAGKTDFILGILEHLGFTGFELAQIAEINRLENLRRD